MAVVLKGEPLPEIQQQSIFHDNVEIRLRWNAPMVTIPNITYGVYYGTTLDELFDSKFKTFEDKSMQTVIEIQYLT